MKKIFKRRVWKIIAVISICLFLLIVLLVGLKAYKFASTKNGLIDVTPEQKARALSLINKAYNSDNFDVKVLDKERVMKFGNQKKHVIMVMLKGRSEFKYLLIDTKSWQIVQSTETKYKSWMSNFSEREFQKQRCSPWKHKRKSCKRWAHSNRIRW